MNIQKLITHKTQPNPNQTPTMSYPNAHLENQLLTCSNKIKVTLPNNVREQFPYVLVAKGCKSDNNTYWIEMQMFKSQHENPIKRYHWKLNTDVMEAITYLAHKFIHEYSIN